MVTLSIFFQIQHLYSFLKKKNRSRLFIALLSLSRHTRRQTTLLDTNSTVLCLTGRIKGKCTAFCCLEYNFVFKGERVIR